MDTDTLHMRFLESFNEDLARLDCGTRVAAVPGSIVEMQIVDLDGAPIGRIPTGIEPETFAACMLIVEESYEDGMRAGMARAGLSPSRH